MVTAKYVVSALVQWSQNHSQYGRKYPPHTPALYDCLQVAHKGVIVPKEARDRGTVDVCGTPVFRVLYSSQDAPKLHRLFIVCPECSREIDAGHFNQHSCALKDSHQAEEACSTQS